MYWARYTMLTLVGFAVFPLTSRAGSEKENLARDAIDHKVASLLSQMTLAEKVGQMTQISLEVVAEGFSEGNVVEPLTINGEALHNAIVNHHVGSILNVGTSAHSIKRWREIIGSIQRAATEQTRLKIPVLYGIDAIHGANYTKDATLFPQSIALGATWDPELVKRTAEITAYEVRASGIPWNFNPVLGVGRQPVWPRLWETFSEDTYLTSTLGVAYVNGLEGKENKIGVEDRVAACMKHFIGYSMPLSGQDRTAAWIPERMLREYFLPPFRAAVEAGAHTLMVNSGEINGIAVHSSATYLTALLRGELGFKGLVVSDWRDIKNLHDRARVAPSYKEATRMAVAAGVDMSMVPLDFTFYDHLLELVQEGGVSMTRINDSVRRILRLKYELDLFANPVPSTADNGEQFASAAFRAVSREAAQTSITLLKNNDALLPLVNDHKILVVGPTADSRSALNGGWTITWQGDREELYPTHVRTLRQAIAERIGKDNVIYVPGAGTDGGPTPSSVLEAARGADLAIVALGEQPYCETPGNIADLRLPSAQRRLTAALQNAGLPTVLVMIEGRPRIITDIAARAEAIVMAYLPGPEGGSALVDVLFGDVNPSGRLPITYPRSTNDLTLYDRKREQHNGTRRPVYDPLFPFGFGLSYTTFAYDNLSLSKASIAMGENLQVRVAVENTGQRAGHEVVQVYVRDLYASVTPSVRRLRAFQKILLQPGERRELFFSIRTEDLSFVGTEMKPVVEPGDSEVIVSGERRRFAVRSASDDQRSSHGNRSLYE